MVTINDHYKDEFKDVVFSVEANSFEKHALWNKHQDKLKLDSHGKLITVAKVNERPICISVILGTINQKKILFWHATSELVDYKLINEWLNAFLPQPLDADNHCDPTNFHICIHALTDS